MTEVPGFEVHGVQCIEVHHIADKDILKLTPVEQDGHVQVLMYPLIDDGERVRCLHLLYQYLDVLGLE
jgi:hypothetical protein